MEDLKQSFWITFFGLSLAVGPVGFIAALVSGDWRYLLALAWSTITLYGVLK